MPLSSSDLVGTHLEGRADWCRGTHNLAMRIMRRNDNDECITTGTCCSSHEDNQVTDVTSQRADPTPSPTATPSTASAAGDPHLQNIYGERFDLMKPGKVTLINAPRGTRVEVALLAVEADARRLGGNCADMYFTSVNITGAWADKLQAGGIRFDADGAQSHKVPMWTSFGPLAVKVVHGRTEEGIRYFNLFVKHLGHAGFAVGGLLGEDDHTEVARTPRERRKQFLFAR
ncbi:unnamed protein product [Prorocentrum cordatum]|uniref:Uncharacterized protein n=1 Tax=Prorocentrum cordatum TaxID=2364126 RepID=A0ABN9THK2_9DINO|nr:unnamed protein product [Polarella glacialis]